MTRRWALPLAVLAALLLALAADPGWVLADKHAKRESAREPVTDYRQRRAAYRVPDAPAEYTGQQNPATSPADIKRGERYYRGKCAECHGDNGEGDAEEPHVVTFADGEYMQTRSDGQLFYIIKFGAGPDAEMEAYGEGSDAGMSDQKVWQLVAYIRTLAK